MTERPVFDRIAADRRVDEVLSDNERLRQANDALRARMERQAALQGEAGAPADHGRDAASWIRRYVEVALEASSKGLMLFTEEGRLLAVNRKATALVPDVAPRLTPGMRFDEVIRILSGSQALDLPSETARVTWAQARLAARGRVAAPALTPLVGDRWIEIAERRAGQGAFALAFDEVTETIIARRRDRTAPAADRMAAAQGAIDQLGIAVGAFGADAQLVLWNDAFRVLLGLGLADLREGLPFAELAGRIAAGDVIDPEGPARRLAEWVETRGVVAAADFGSASFEIVRRDGVIVAARCRETPEGGFVVSLADVTAERRAALEVAKVRETLEQRVFERTSALVEVNDKLVQEIAERRAIEAEMRRARDAAEAANLSKTRFLAAASHDLLQPLNAAKLFVSALTSSPLPEAEAAIARRVESAFSSVETLLNALLDISKLDAGGGDVAISDFPVARILDPVAEEFRVLAVSRGLRFRVAPSTAIVRSDPHHLRRIVQNLVANALKYTVEGGVIVGCRRRGGQLRIEVWDSGVGIPAAERRRIFEEFHRIDAANPRGERGMGLGLAIVDRACRLLGHPVDLRSAEGGGSRFAVTVPIGSAAAVEIRADAPETMDFADGGGGMIALLVEDDATVRAATAALLDRWGVDVLEAASADEALTLSEQLGMAPDVVILDYHLGEGVTGLDALARLRSAFGPDLPAVLVTADRSRAVALEAERARAQLLTKPVAPAKLRSLLHWSRAERPRA
jgi:signal transduction histidine kinase